MNKEYDKWEDKYKEFRKYESSKVNAEKIKQLEDIESFMNRAMLAEQRLKEVLKMSALEFELKKDKIREEVYGKETDRT